jgi:hypothetical protein
LEILLWVIIFIAILTIAIVYQNLQLKSCSHSMLLSSNIV